MSNTEVASLVVSADAQTEQAERALDRLGLKYDATVQRFRNSQGTFVSAANVQRQLAGEMDKTAKAAGDLKASFEKGASSAQHYGAVLTASVTLPIVAAAAGITKVGIEYQNSQNL